MSCNENATSPVTMAANYKFLKKITSSNCQHLQIIRETFLLNISGNKKYWKLGQKITNV